MTPLSIPLNGNGHGSSVSLLRRNAIDIHRAFADMHPVIHRTRMLSLNAVVASARSGTSGVSFGVIANELSGVAGELARLIGEMEKLFHTVVKQIARTVQAEDRRRLFSRGLKRSLEPVTPQPLPCVISASAVRLSGEAGSNAATPALHQPTDPSGQANQSSLESQIQRSELALLDGLGEVEALSQQLAQRINRINWVAVRQSHITAVAAQIEAARTAKGSGLMEVARIVRDLATQIAETESAAKDKIVDLQTLAGQVVGPLREEYIRVHSGEAR